MIDNNEFTIHLIRHGESEVNADPDQMGQTSEIKLTEKGKMQAQLLRNRFLKRKDKFDFIFSSTHVRALDTAKLSIPNPDQQIILSSEIVEYDAGLWTGTKRSTTITPEILSKMNYLNQLFLPPNGESFAMVERRASQWLEDNILYNPKMIEYSKKYGPPNIACYSHGLTIKSLLHYIVGFDKSFTWKVKIDNTSITTLYFGNKGWELLGVNDCFHLEI